MTDSLKSLENWPRNGKKLRVTLIGAGNVAHVIAGKLGARHDCAVSLMSRRPGPLQHAVTHGITINHNPVRKVGSKTADGKLVQAKPTVGKIERASSNPYDVIPDADVIILTNPSHTRPATLAKIVPHISSHKPVLLGALPGVGGFDWMCSTALGLRPQLTENVKVWALKDIPFMSTRTIPGKV